MRGRAGLVMGAVVLGASLSVGCAALADLLRQPHQVHVDWEARRVEAVGPLDPVTNLPETRNFDAVYTDFFPSEIPVHAGDTTFFKVDSRGEPHTLAMGTLVDEAAAAIDALGAGASLEEIEALPEMQAIPSVYPLAPEDSTSITVNGSAADPCYLDHGSPPTSRTGGAPRCENRSKPSFNGRQTFWSSGVLEEREIFKVDTSGDIDEGTYEIMCLIHRSQMRARINVVPDSRNLPTPGSFEDTAREENTIIRDRLRGPANQAWAATDPTDLVAGVGVPASSSYIASFPVDDTRVSVGQDVTWTLFGTHSVTFDAPGGADDGPLDEQDGAFRVNPEAWLPINSSELPVQAVSYPPSDGEPILVDGGEWNGEGDFHSGIMRSLPPAQVSYTMRFTEPGTYDYYCVIHPTMTGTIVVE